MNSEPNSARNRGDELSVSVVLHHSDIDRLEVCLNSLRASIAEAIHRGLLQSARISLVDNSCEERYRLAVNGLLDSLAEVPGQTSELLSLSENRGFGHAHNRVMDSVPSDFHLILNPDTELEPAALSAGITAIMEEGAVLASPRVVGADGQQEFLCKRYPSVMLLLLRGFAPGFVRRWFQPRLSEYEMRDVCIGNERADVPIASGCFMLVRVSALRETGGFDDGYFLYFEDFDLSIRLQSRGRLVYVPEMRIKHYGGYAARKGLRHLRHFVASGVRFFHRYGWRWT